MSIRPGSTGISAVLPSAAVRPLTFIFATRRPGETKAASETFFEIILNDGQNGYVSLSGQYEYAVSIDRSGDYGSAGDGKIDPGLKFDTFYAGGWCWWMLRPTSPALRSLMVQANGPYTNTQDHSAKPADLRGMNLRLKDADTITRMAWLSMFTATVSEADFAAIRGGTKNPRDVAGFYDGASFESGMATFNGLLSFTGTPAGYEASDNPSVAAAGGGAPAGGKLIASGFGW